MLASAQSLLGVVLIPLIAWALSEDRRALKAARVARITGSGLALQGAIAAVLLLVPQTQIFFAALAAAVGALQGAMIEGMKVVFGYLAGGPQPFETVNPQNSFVFAFQALPLILVMSVLSRLLYHWGVLQRVVRAFAWVLQKTLSVGGALGTSAAANIFVGMVEAPLLVRPYLRDMARDELFAAMTVGMATVAGTVMALYATIVGPVVEGAAGHILAASVMSAPAALMLARLMVPAASDGAPAPVDPVIEDPPRNAMDAIAQGTGEGLKLLAYVAAMMVVMVALVALVNVMLAPVGNVLGMSLTAQAIFGWLMSPLAFIIGIPWGEAAAAGELIGVKTVLNEFLAYLQLAKAAPGELSERSRLILTYALCGFANLGSLGIMTGGLIAMAPERRADIVSLGPKTIVSGTLATLLTGAVIGVFTPA